MEFCGVLFVLGILAAVVHSLWTLVARIIRSGASKHPVREWAAEPKNRVRCPRCGAMFFSDYQFCPSCGLDYSGPVAKELLDLEATARSLQVLLDRKLLDPALSETIYRSIETRQNSLLREDAVPEVLPVEQVSEVRPTAEPPALRPEPQVLPVEEMAPLQSVPEIAPPPTPRRTWGQVLSGFMEERNILWGELVGGLLIVGCSVALVVSLWRTLEEQIHYFPFLVVAALTAGLFAAGRYTLSHWKLEATSRGLMVIATLLTPLNFLVLAGLSRGRHSGLIDWGLELTSTLAFAALVRYSARVTIASALQSVTKWADWLLALAVAGASASQLLVPRWLDLAEPIVVLFVCLSLAPAVLQALAVSPLLWAMSRRERIEASEANALLLVVGQTVFAVAVALGFVVYWSDTPLKTFGHLAIPVAVAGWPLLAAGALIHSKVSAAAAEESEIERALTPHLSRMLGTVLGLAGMAIMLAALAMGWPRPAALILIGLGNAAIFMALAIAIRLPVAQLPASACLAIGCLTLFHWYRGELNVDEAVLGARLLALVGSSAGAVGLTLVAALLAIFAEVHVRLGRLADGAYQLLVAGLLAVAALILVTLEGVTIPERGSLVFGICAMGAFLINVRRFISWITTAASVVALGFIIYLIAWTAPTLTESRRWLLALLIHATSAGLASHALYRTWRTLGEFRVLPAFAVPLRDTALWASCAALIPLFALVSWETLDLCAAASLWLAAIWLGFAWLELRQRMFAACQAAITLAGCFWLVHLLVQKPWFDTRYPFELWSLQFLTLGLSILSLDWAVLRLVLRRVRRAQVLLEPEQITVDRVVLFVLVIFQAMLASLALVPQLIRECVSQATVDRSRILPLDLVSARSAIAILAGALFLNLRSRRSHETMLTLLFLALTVPVVVANGFRDQQAAASAFRWAAALAFLVCSVPVWSRGQLAILADQLGITRPTRRHTARDARVLLIVFALVPAVALTVWIAARVFAGDGVAGPLQNSVFASIDLTTSMRVPLLILVLGLVGHGLREDGAGYIFSAGQILVAALAGGYALMVVNSGTVFSLANTILLIQIGVVTAAFWTIGWLATRRWRDLGFLRLQVALGAGFGLALVSIGLLVVLASLGRSVPKNIENIGQPLGWTAWATTTLIAAWVVCLHRPARLIHILGVAGVAAGAIAACGVVQFDRTAWMPYHVLTISWTALALVLLIISWVGSAVQAIGPGLWSAERRALAAEMLRTAFPARMARRWVELLSTAVVLLAVCGAWGDPSRPYWSSAATVAVSILFGAMAVWTRRPGYVYASCLLLNIVAFLVWQAWLIDELGVSAWLALGPGVTDRLLLMQALAFASSGLVWSLIEWALRRRIPPIDLRGRGLPATYAMALLALQLLIALVLTGLAGDLNWLGIQFTGSLIWAVLGVTVAALVIQFWDPEANSWGMPTAALYVAGMIIVGLAIHQQSLTPRDVGWAAGIAVSGYVLLVNLLVRLAPYASPLARRLGVPAQVESRLAGWFIPAQTIIGIVGIILSIWMCLDFPTTAGRMGGPLAVTLLMLAGAVLTGTRNYLGRPELSALIALSLGALLAVETSWAFLDPDVPAPWLHRNARLLIVLSIVGALYGSRLVGLLQRGSFWAGVSRQVAAALGLLAAGALIVVVWQEFVLYNPDEFIRRTPLGHLEMFGVVAVLFAAIVWALSIAASRRPEPFGFTDVGRTNCVWAAELLLVILLVHLRLNVPDIYPKFFGQYWPFTLMTIGFIGVGFGELLHRRGLPALAGPLHRTGLFLPLVPLMAYIIRPLGDFQWLGGAIPGMQPILRYLDRLSPNYHTHAALWFLLGTLYALVSIMRRTSGFALFAALAANFGLWVIYANNADLAFALHPQLWLIPVGIILLVAEFLNRDRLRPDRAAAVRYFGMLIIYVSSSADMFITGLGNSVVLPIALALLSVAGVLAGIMLRVRGFLFLGVAFLAEVILAQIWHAAIDRQQKWVLWASGIVLGIAVISLFAYFEKRRNDVLRIIEDIKQWD